MKTKGKRRINYHQKITNYEPKHNIRTFCPTGTKIIWFYPGRVIHDDESFEDILSI